MTNPVIVVTLESLGKSLKLNPITGLVDVDISTQVGNRITRGSDNGLYLAPKRHIEISEFTITANGVHEIALTSSNVEWSALTINGLRQPPSTYGITSSTLTIPAELVWVGASVLLEYLVT